MSTHTIRLAGPWELQVDSCDDSTRIQLPFDLPPNCHSVSLIRRFHRPSGLTDESLVRVELEMNGFVGHVTVNGEQISATQRSGTSCSSVGVPGFDVTSALLPFNVLQVDLTSRMDGPTEIRSAAVVIEEP